MIHQFQVKERENTEFCAPETFAKQMPRTSNL